MMAEDYAIPISVNHDHCSSVEAAMEAVDAGVNGVMFDGSGLPFDENVEKTGQVADYAKGKGQSFLQSPDAFPHFPLPQKRLL